MDRPQQRAHRCRHQALAPHGPILHQPTLVAVGSNNMHVSRVNPTQKFEFARDSAGLGVPRSTFGSLNKLSQQVATRGTATTNIRADAAATAYTTRLMAGQPSQPGQASQPGQLSQATRPQPKPRRTPDQQPPQQPGTAAGGAPLSRPVAVHASSPGSSVSGTCPAA